MLITKEIINGSMVAANAPPPPMDKNILRISGEFAGKRSVFGIDESALSKHTLFVGGTGSGKTNLFYHFVSQLMARMTPNDVMLIFDSKGDFYNKFSKPGDLVIGNSPIYRKISTKWNIYREITADGSDKTSVIQNTQEICRSLFSEKTEKNTSNPFFPNAARDLLASILLALFRDGVELNNIELKTYLETSSVRQIRDLLKTQRDLASVLAYIDGESGAQAQGVLSEMYFTVRDIFTGVFADAGDFSIRRFVRQKKGRTLCLEYDMSIGDVLSPIYTLLFDLALKEALGRTATQGNVYLIADELKLLPNLRHLEDGINFGRGLGVKILAGLQSIDQLKANYSNEAQATNIISGFSSIYAFRSNDFNTREYVSKLFGKNLVFERDQLTNGQIRFIVMTAIISSLLASFLSIIEDEEDLTGIPWAYLTQILLLAQFWINAVIPFNIMIFWGLQYIYGIVSVRSGYSKIVSYCKASYCGMFDFMRTLTSGPGQTTRAKQDAWIAFVLSTILCICFFAMIALLVLFLIFNRQYVLGGLGS
ncbi:MAG: type IV secretion system DNA-binding domain-containing protein [Ruminococcus sp.]|nr:type IV secretion system DNA-binding domain-containing protein [Ruminococcus sp.]